MGLSKIEEARVKLLDMQLEAAVVEKAEEDGYFNVFVPNALREHNVVAAEDEEAAKSKVRDFLIEKQRHVSDSASDVTVKPDNARHALGTKELK